MTVIPCFHCFIMEVDHFWCKVINQAVVSLNNRSLATWRQFLNTAFKMCTLEYLTQQNVCF